MKRKDLSLNALGSDSADKRMEILRLVGATGSISEAGRQAGVSYKAAWQAIHTLTNLAGVTLVDSVVGGAGGGGARLTPDGLRLLDAAQQMDAARQSVLARFGAGTGQAVAGAGLRTSMRNNLPCTVLRLESGAVGEPMVRVHLSLLPSDEMVSCITRESVELLGLAVGTEVLALCKATGVTVSPVTANTTVGPTINQLFGRVFKLSKGKQQDEVVVTLAGGLQVVGFAHKPHRLRAGSRATVQLDERAVVLART